MSPHPRILNELLRARDRWAARFPGSPFAAWQQAATRRATASRPDAHYQHLPPPVRTKLARLARRIVHEQWLRGLCWLVGTLAVLLPAQGLWDWLVDLPVAARAALLAVDLLIAGGLAWVFWFAPRLPSLEECALRVERHFTDLRSALISAVQFSPRPPEPIVRVLLEQVEKRTADKSFDDVAPRTVLRRHAWVAGSLLALQVVLFPLTQPASGILFRRLLLGNQALPATTTLVSVTGDAEVIAGEEIRIEARASGRLPLAGRLEVQRPGAPLAELPMVRSTAAPDTYTAVIQNTQESFTYRVQVKRAFSPWHTIQVVRPPALASVGFTQRYPGYTGKAPATMEPGNLALYAGSRLAITATATKPLRAAYLVMPGREPLPLPVTGENVQGELPVPATGLDSFSLALEDADGVPSRNDTRFRVRIVPDEPPRIDWAPGGAERRALLVEARPRLAFSVSDDFQVTSVELVAFVSPEMREIRIPLHIPRPAPGYAFDEVIEQPGALLPWEGGAIISYWIEARDNNNVTGPGVGRSSIREWTLFTREQKREEMQKQLREEARRVKELADRQQKLREEVGKVLEP